MSERRTKAGRELVEAMGEALDDIRGKKKLPSRLVHIPEEVDVKVIRAGLGMTQRAFAAEFGFDLRSLQEWEQGRRNPTGHARAYLLVISRNAEAVREALSAA